MTVHCLRLAGCRGGVRGLNTRYLGLVPVRASFAVHSMANVTPGATRTLSCYYDCTEPVFLWDWLICRRSMPMGGPLYVHLSDSAICYEMRTWVLRYKNVL
jgi:hypothetical protein